MRRPPRWWHRVIGKAPVGKLKAAGDPWSSVGPNTGTVAATTGGKIIPAYYKRQGIRLSIDTLASGAAIYGLLGTAAGPPSATNFHFALIATQPPLELEYSGQIQIASNTSTVQVGVIEY